MAEFIQILIYSDLDPQSCIIFFVVFVFRECIASRRKKDISCFENCIFVYLISNLTLTFILFFHGLFSLESQDNLQNIHRDTVYLQYRRFPHLIPAVSTLLNEPVISQKPSPNHNMQFFSWTVRVGSLKSIYAEFL